MVERVRKTYWEWGGGRKRGGMERKERERMVVRDKQDGGRERLDPLDAVRDRREVGVL